MRKILILSAIVGVAAINLNNVGGSPGGRTGSPVDGTSCAVGCHVGQPRNVTGWITSNIPSTGIVAGQTYRITLAASDVTSNKFGFELSAESSIGSKQGSFTLVNTSETALTPSGSVTHTMNGVTGSNGAKSWRVDWTAPNSLPADITFYAAVNASDNSGDSSGDLIYLTKFDAPVAPSTVGIESQATNGLRIFPNPVANELHVSDVVDELRLIDIQGKILETVEQTNAMDVSVYPEGLYFVSITSEGASFTKKVFIKK